MNVDYSCALAWGWKVPSKVMRYKQGCDHKTIGNFCSECGSPQTVRELVHISNFDIPKGMECFNISPDNEHVVIGWKVKEIRGLPMAEMVSPFDLKKPDQDSLTKGERFFAEEAIDPGKFDLWLIFSCNF